MVLVWITIVDIVAMVIAMMMVECCGGGGVGNNG